MSRASLERLSKFVENVDTAEVTLASIPRVIGDVELQRLAMTNELAGVFTRIAQDTASELAEMMRLVEYDPGHKLETDEIFVLPLEGIGEAAGIVEGLIDHQNLPQFVANPDFVRDLKFYSIGIYDGVRRASFIRAFGKTRVVRGTNKVIAYFGKNGVYDEVPEESLIFDEKTDIVLWEGVLYIINHFNFAQIFRVAEALRAKVKGAVQAMHARFPIYNFEEFLEACSGQVQMMSKAVRIPEKEYFLTLTIDDIKSVIRAFKLDLRVAPNAAGAESLVFDGSLATRWLILKVLDDDYLNSEMTSLRYEVNSKLEH